MRRFLFECLLSRLRNSSSVIGSPSARAAALRARAPRQARPIHAFLVLLVFSSALFARAQKEIVTVTNWRVHAGDNPAWANPDFGDSKWTPNAYDQMDSFGLPTGTRWYRATFQVPADFAGQDLAVGMGPVEEVYDLYVDGIRVGGYGSWQPAPHAPFPRHLVFPLPAGVLKSGVGHIAIRQWRGAAGLEYITFASSGRFEFTHRPEIGSRTAIEAQERLHSAEGMIQELPWDLTDLLFLFAACISFVLFSAQLRRAEYLYLGIFSVLQGAPTLIGSAVASRDSVMARSWGPVLIFALPILADAFALLFLAALCPRIRRILRIGAILLAVFALVASYSLAEQSSAATLLWMYGSSWGLAAFELIATWSLLRDRRLGSTVIGISLLLSAAGWALWIIPSEFHWNRSFYFYAGPFRIDLPSVTGILFVFVTLLVLYVRYRDEQTRQAVVDQDLAAARRMQQQLLAIAENPPAGFAVDAVYRPAREVGGDFYRTVALEDGSLLVIVGDVSGKGLDAAMLVAVILGSLANETHRSPASLLAYLNRAVLGRTAGGFITACCARFYPDGRVVFANAGQIAPYIEDREVQLENGLPLGIGADAGYTETEIVTDAAVTFVSDDVVEARDAKGELLGFERTAALTKKRASEIAETAQRWGQEDDITVLTVARAPRPAPEPSGAAAVAV